MCKFRILSVVMTFIAAATSVSAAHVSFSNGNITFTESFEQGVITIDFSKCMYNNLYTFSNVKLNNIALNTTSSDNIGPFLVGGMWSGGNHAYPDNYNPIANTAKTLSYTVWVDGKELVSSESLDCDVLEVEVVNELYYFSANQPYTFAIETIRYRVSGNSIEIWGNHKYEYNAPLSISRYYGMQSMFNNETAILTPGGKMKYWTTFTPGGDANRLEFTKQSAPNFCTFIERNNNGYQAAYMTRDGIGDRSMVSDNDIVFTGNNWGKSYHKLIGDRTVKKGDETSWHGIYSWFKEPLIDECNDKSNPQPKFAYPAYINGRAFEMHLDASGKMTQTSGIENVVTGTEEVFAYAGEGAIIIADNAPDAVCVDLTGKIIARGAGTFKCGAGVYIVSDMNGHSVKLIVR